MKNCIVLNKAQYLINDQVILTIALNQIASDTILVKIYQLHHHIAVEYQYKYIQKNDSTVELMIQLSSLPIGNYGVEVIIGYQLYETAFDIVSSYKDCVRYGFLSDFSNQENDILDVENLKNLHLNTVQFYDWMYTHDQLVSKDINYLDPLGRPTSLETIKHKIEKCIEYGMRPFAYGAVYASSKTLYEKHPEWGLYTLDHQPLVFFDWLNFMNISNNSGWSDYIINQFIFAIETVKFMGIHMDTYGFPKNVHDYNGKNIALADHFPALINRASQKIQEINPQNGVIFNCVNNWPIEKIANTNQDAIYIEVWPPHDSYFDLYRLIREAKYLSHNQVVLAAYMHPFKDAKTPLEIEKAENALLLTNAVINASGGTQLVFGEKNGILQDSYYANYAVSSENFQFKIQNYADFLVRYADLLYNDIGMDISMTATSGINEDIQFISNQVSFSPNGKDNTVWTIVREQQNRITIQLINLSNNNSMWNQPKNKNEKIEDITIKLNLDRIIKGIYFASPDESLMAQSLNYLEESTNRGKWVTVQIPSLSNWTTVWIEME